MSSSMALPRWFVSEKLDRRRDDFRELLLDAVTSDVLTHVHLAFMNKYSEEFRKQADRILSASGGFERRSEAF